MRFRLGFPLAPQEGVIVQTGVGGFGTRLKMLHSGAMDA